MSNGFCQALDCCGVGPCLRTSTEEFLDPGDIAEDLRREEQKAVGMS